jgi:O-antigen ligase
MPLMAKGLAALLVVVCVAWPASGLLAFAGLAPLSTAIANLCGGGDLLGPQLLEQMALAVGVAALVRPARPETRTRLGPPALLLAIVAFASAMAVLPAIAAPLAPGLGDALRQLPLALRHTAQVSPVGAPLFAALLIAECGLLGWAVERAVRQTPDLAMRLVAMSLVGHAGAGVLNFRTLLSAALRTADSLHALWGLLTGVRLSMQTDVHAAASALLLAGVAGLGLTSGPRARRLGTVPLLLLVALGLWITGSRVAIVLGAVTAVATVGWLVSRGSRRGRLAVAGVAMLAVAAGLWLALNMREQSTRQGTVSYSVNARVLLAKAGLQMFEQNPVFGIGITRFYGSSTGLLGGSLGENFRQNAHNNFIQVLAEQGVVGLGALLWCLAVVLGGGVRAQFSSPAVSRGCLIAAIAACIGTWMTGHPLLVPEFAFVFWLYLGLLAAMTPAPPNSRQRWVAWMLVAGVLISVPLRARAHLNVADLEHRGFGVSSLWQHDDEQRYREAGASFALYLPAAGRLVAVPFRRAPGTPDPLLVDVTIDGRVIDTISVGGDIWQIALIQMPEGPRLFQLVDFAVKPQSGTSLPGVLLRVGRDAVR